MSTTALERITNAFLLLQVFQPGDTIPMADSAYALTVLNDFLRSLKLDVTMAPVNVREVFPIVAGKGSPDTPYTIGPGGDFNTTRPATNAEITGAADRLGTTGVELPRGILNDSQYNDIRIKGLPSALPTWLYYNTTYAGGLGTIQLYPVPNVATDALVLYRQQPLATFASLTAAYDLPEGYEMMIDYNLADLLQVAYGKVLPPSAVARAESSLSLVKRSNLQMNALQLDPMFLGGRSGGIYDISTGDVH